MLKYRNFVTNLLKSYLCLANILITILLLTSLIQLYFQLDSQAKPVLKSESIEIRILSETSRNFQKIYFAENSLRVWQLKTKDKFKLGNRYLIQGAKKLFNFSTNIYTNDIIEDRTSELNTKKENLSLSNAVIGVIETKSIKHELGCDILCAILYQVNTLKAYASTEILRLSCNIYGNDWVSLSPFDSCSDISALLQGLLLGGSQNFSEQMQSNFKITGVTHIVAISGFNITLIIVLVESILKKFELTFSIQFWIILIFLLLFIILVGTSASVLRAGLMGFFILLAKLVKRPCSGLRALLLASVVLLLYNPFYLFSVSFQLSFLATFGLLSFLNLEEITSQKWLIGVFENAWATIVANLYTLPVLVNTFGYFSPLSILPNLIILPLVPFIMLLDLTILLPLIGKYIGFSAAICCAWVLGLIQWFGTWLPLIYLDHLNWVEVVIWYLFLLTITKIYKFKKNIL